MLSPYDVTHVFISRILQEFRDKILYDKYKSQFDKSSQEMETTNASSHAKKHGNG